MYTCTVTCAISCTFTLTCTLQLYGHLYLLRFTCAHAFYVSLVRWRLDWYVLLVLVLPLPVYIALGKFTLTVNYALARELTHTSEFTFTSYVRLFRVAFLVTCMFHCRLASLRPLLRFTFAFSGAFPVRLALTHTSTFALTGCDNWRRAATGGDGPGDPAHQTIT